MASAPNYGSAPRCGSCKITNGDGTGAIDFSNFLPPTAGTRVREIRVHTGPTTAPGTSAKVFILVHDGTTSTVIDTFSWVNAANAQQAVRTYDNVVLTPGYKLQAAVQTAVASGATMHFVAGGQDLTFCTWYTQYLHMQTCAVAAGDVVSPRQLLGTVGEHAGGAHLHLGLGDGVPLVHPTGGAPICGQTIDVTGWLARPINGSHVGTPPARASYFSASELAFIQAHFAFPLSPNLNWVTGIGSTFHNDYDYYAADLILPPLIDIHATVGQPVFAAFKGGDVRTVVESAANFGGDLQWCVTLRHDRIG